LDNTGQALKVLLIDDEIRFADTLALRLSMRGMNADTAYNGEQGLLKLRSAKADVVILDLKMPGMGGKDVLREIRKTYPELPVVVLTGHGNDADEEDIIRLGGSGFLRKPADIDHLEEKIRNACRGRTCLSISEGVIPVIEEEQQN
jgi:two-component system, OmpR family, response regulator CpxR